MALFAATNEGGKMNTVRLTHLDGKLPNLALMRLARWHRDRGDEVHFTRSVERELFEPVYDLVYGSAIFSFTSARTEQLRRSFPGAIVGGTGTGSSMAIEDVLPGEPELLDYADYPDFRASIGFTARGCRLKCKFCVVPAKEGKPRSVCTVADIWRGVGHPKQLHLLDNDFFGQPRSQWQARLREIREGSFKVCFNQGINIRLVDDEIAAELASVEYRDDQFQERRLYAAWDNLKDETVFFRGVESLARAGIRPKHLMVYMLIGWDPIETEERIFRRFNRMVERGIEPYPMVYDRRRRDLCAFQRWAVTGLYRSVPWSEYRHYARRKEPIPAAQSEMSL
jgi:hypothetical protein